MARTITTTLQVSVSGDGATSATTTTQTNSIGLETGPQPVTLSAGINSFTIPTGHSGAVIVPPTNSINAKTLRGVAGDAGVAFTNLFQVVQPGAGGAFVINAASQETITVQYV